MPDRETTLRDLENLGAWHTHHYTQFHYEAAETIHNALTLLRGQNETTNNPPFQRHDCGALIVYRGRDVCPNCGRKVKWDA